MKRTAPLVRMTKRQRRTARRHYGQATGLPKPLNEFPPAVRRIIKVRAEGRCEICNGRRGVMAHHRRPRRREGWREGTNVASNGLWICADCDHRMECSGPGRRKALDLGQILGSWQDPAVERVLYRGRVVVLGDDGTVTEVEGDE